MNFTHAACGHTVLAVGAPGSEARRSVENELCDQCEIFHDSILDLLMCNCAECRRELLGRNQEIHKWVRDLIGTPSDLPWLREMYPQGLPPVCHTKIDGRPYCFNCWYAREQAAERAGRRSGGVAAGGANQVTNDRKGGAI